MLEHFAILSETGLVLWAESLNDEDQQETVMHQPLNALVKNVLLKQRHSQKTYTHGNYAMKWTLENELDLIFVVVFNRIIGSHLTYLDDLLMNVKKEFLKMFKNQLKAMSLLNAAGQLEFSTAFHRIWTAVESRSGKKKPAPPVDSGPPEEQQHQPANDSEDVNSAESAEENGSDVQEEDDNLTPSERAKMRLQKMKGRGKRGKGPGPGGAKAAGAKKKPGTSEAPKAKRKAEKSKLNTEDIKALDVNKALEQEDDHSKVDYTGAAAALDEESSDNEEEETGTSGWFSSTTVGSLLGSLTGSKTLQAQDVDPILEELRAQLMEKNVGSDIAEDLCKSVSSSLVGKKLERLTLVQTQVKHALQEAIERLLSPTRSTDVLADIRAKKLRGDKRPYTIVFIGVNGVGKSTSLSKVAYYLKDSGMKVMMAACDSFRSGAVEQLRRHASSLDVPLFQRGYNTDPVNICREAIAHAQKEGYDVVTVDTAGRMQNNSSLMHALANLVNENNPDLVLFVGEALVGNDGVDQLTTFDRALIDYAKTPNPRHIDGIMLTKFDTIDDKVGAALSMVYRTGVPIFFVGTGQKYMDVRKLNVKSVVKALLS